MSILKSILHHYNKTTKSYDTLHPETESAQITDWNQGIVNTLASTALGTLVSTLTSDSLLATMIQKVLTASGVKYNIAQNGYICFGEFFGGLILQWGIPSFTVNATYEDVALPISFNNSVICVQCTDAVYDSTTSSSTEVVAWNVGASTISKIRLLANTSSSGYKNLGLFTWIAIGK